MASLKRLAFRGKVAIELAGGTLKFAILASVCLIYCAGCASASNEQVAALAARAEPILPSSLTTFISDEREAKFKLNIDFGDVFLAIHSCNMGVHNIGDVGGASDRVARLDRDLSQAFGPQPAEPRAVLRKYSIFFNDAYLLAPKPGTQGLVGDVIVGAAFKNGVGQRPKCDREEMAGGWFDPSDLSNLNSPITVDIEINFRGRDYAVTAAYSPPYEIGEAGPLMTGSFWGIKKVEKPEWIAAVQLAMAKANARLIESIKATIPPSATTFRVPARQEASSTLATSVN